MRKQTSIASEPAGHREGAHVRRGSVGYVRAIASFFRDPSAPLAGKVFVLAILAYIACPVDLLPDVAPLLGWLDDLGLAGLALAYLGRVARRYRHPVLEATATVRQA